MFQLLVKGGWLMLPIAICSVFSLAIIIDRFVYFFRISVDSEDFLSKLFSLVKKLQVKEAIALCEEKDIPLTNILKAALLNYDQPKEIIKEAVEETSLYEVPRLEKNLGLLATIAHISPLLGLLGTVTGIINCFSAIEKNAASLGVVNAGDLAKGIYEALFTTAFGLVVAIPSYIAYNYFVNKVNFHVLEIEKSTSELISVLTEKSSSLVSNR